MPMSTSPVRAIAAALLIAIPVASPPAASPQENPNRPPWAQKSAAPAGEESPKVTAGASSEDQDPAASRAKIRVNVNLVSVLVSVLDSHNRPAPDLPRESFELYEEGVLQKIEVFESETQQPLDLALMIDASLSAHKEITFEQEAASRFIRQVLRTGDRLAVFSFDESVTQLAAFSENVFALQDAVRRIPPGAGTSIYDALVLGSRSLEKRGENRRRVIILVTDGGETTSHSDFEAARATTLRSGALLYTILIRPVKTESGRNTAGEHALVTITDTTGGAMFFPDAPQELDSIFDRINRELRTQYRLAYYPNPRGPANTYRSIEVNVPGDYQIRHRKTYLTGAQ